MLPFLIVALLMPCFLKIMEIVSTRKISMEVCELVGINHLSYPLRYIFFFNSKKSLRLNGLRE